MEIEVKEEESLCSSSESDFNDEDDGEIGDLGEHMEIKKKPLRMVPFYHIGTSPCPSSLGKKREKIAE